jgi:predicted RNA-binding protein
MEVPMPTVRRLLIAALALVTITSSSAFADPQQHVIDPSQLAATIEQNVAKQDADRAAIREALARPQVRAVATNIGVDLAKASAAVDTLTGYELTRAGDTARQINEQLVGGASTVVISTTTIIIVLLLLILLIVIVKA